MTPAPNPVKAAAQLRCRQPRMTSAPGESPYMVACQDREVVGVYDILDDETWIRDKNPRRIPLCRECADSYGLTAGPIATAEDLPAMIEAGVDWCHLMPGLRICWCPSHGLIEED